MATMAATTMPEIKQTVVLQPKQMEAYQSLMGDPTPYLMYGGAKGGGKSYLVRAGQVDRRLKYPGTIGVIIRKTHPELLANHIRKMFEEYPAVKRFYRESHKAIYWPNGSITEFRYLERTNDVYNYQGIEYDDITLDEATQHEENVFKILKTSLRSDPRIRNAYPDYKPKFLLTGNPGGVGHGWVKRLFIDREYQDGETPDDYKFIPAKIWDNGVFIDANPEYLRILQELPRDLRRAYLEGDWDVFLGQYFRMWRESIHTVEPFEIPDEWPKMFAVDWGYFPHPFHVGWYAFDQLEKVIYKYREWSDVEHSPDDLAEGIIRRTQEDINIRYGVGDTQMWAIKNIYGSSKGDQAQTVKSISMLINDKLAVAGLTMQQANKERVNGWIYLKSLLQWQGHMGPDGRTVVDVPPRYRVFSTCSRTVGAYPNQIHSELVPEDMLKQDGDDPCDTDRYAVMHIQEREMPEVKTLQQRLDPAQAARDAWSRRFPGVIFAETPRKRKIAQF